MGFSIKNIFGYLQKNNVGDQIHIRDNEIVFYHWNRTMSDLIPSVSVHANKIEQIYYSRSILPLLYRFINHEIEDDLIGDEKYVKDKRKTK